MLNEKVLLIHRWGIRYKMSKMLHFSQILSLNRIGNGFLPNTTYNYFLSFYKKYSHSERNTKNAFMCGVIKFTRGRTWEKNLEKNEFRCAQSGSDKRGSINLLENTKKRKHQLEKNSFTTVRQECTFCTRTESFFHTRARLIQ